MSFARTQIDGLGSTANDIGALLAGWVADGPTSFDPEADFLARSTGPDIVRAWGFNSAADLNSGIDGNVMTGPSDASNPPQRYPVLDPLVKCSGNSSMRVDTPTRSTSNASGFWSGNFSNDLSVRFGANTQFYEQLRFRINDVLAETVFKAIGGGVQGGMKIFDVIAGNMLGGPRPDGWGITKFSSSTEIKIVVQSYYQHLNPFVYRYLLGATNPLFEGVPSDILLQNKIPACLYTGGQGIPPKSQVPGCWTLVKDNWMTFEIGVGMGDEGLYTNSLGATTDVWLDSTVKLWAAYEGQPPTLLLDWNPSVPGYEPLWRGPPSDDQRYGQTVLFDYMTSKDPIQDHGLGQAWYDELIVSRKPIAFPGGYSIGP